jgi:hypothetical protein
MKTFLREAQVSLHQGKSAVDVTVAKPTGATQIFTMNYCPFCGTRIVSNIIHRLARH